MSRLDLEHCGEQRRWLAYDRLYLPKPATVVTDSSDGLYDLAEAAVRSAGAVTFVEFGVAHGETIRKFTNLLVHPDTRLYAFDSFVGLPEAWKMHDAGAFSNLGRPPEVEDARVVFVKGWFQDTLHSALSQGLAARLQSTSVLIHFDADLYASTLFLLTSLWPVCRTYHFIMDDFMVDDIVALHDFTLAYPVDLRFVARLSGGVPHKVLGKIDRAPFRANGL